MQYIGLLVPISFVIIIPFLSHLFYKKRQKRLLELMQGHNYLSIPKVSFTLLSYSPLSVRFDFLNGGDLVVFQKNILIFQRGIFIGRSQPVIQMVKRENLVHFNGLTIVLSIETMEVAENVLKIKVYGNRGGTSVFKLDFSGRESELNSFCEHMISK